MSAKKTLRLEDIDIGKEFSFEHVFSQEDEKLFSQLTGDTSALRRSDIEDIKRDEKLVHGMLAASFFSTLIDEHCPGPDSLYISQSLIFRKPIFYGQRVAVRGTVLAKSESTRTIALKTEVLCDGVVAIYGEARVKLLT